MIDVILEQRENLKKEEKKVKESRPKPEPGGDMSLIN